MMTQPQSPKKAKLMQLWVHLANLDQLVNPVYLVMMVRMVTQAVHPGQLALRVTLVVLENLVQMERWDQLVNQVRSA